MPYVINHSNRNKKSVKLESFTIEAELFLKDSSNLLGIQ